MAKAKQQELSIEEKLEQVLVPEDEQTYEVPSNWVWTYLTLGFADCLDSYRKPVNTEERADRKGEIPYYGATGQVGWIDDYLTNENLVLLGEDGAPFFDYLKDKAYIIEGKAWVNNHAHILKSKFGIIGNKFLMHYLNIFNYRGYVNGTTRLKLTQASMSKVPTPLPPLAEQQRIIERIESLFEKLDNAKELSQNALDTFETRKAAILHKAFTGELTAKWRQSNGLGKDSWKKEKVGAICTDIKVGIVIKPSQYYTDKETGIPAFRSANVRESFINDSDWVYLTQKGNSENPRSIVHTGDVLVVRSGNPGTACVVSDEYDGYNSIDIIIAVPHKEVVDSKYLCSYTNSPECKRQISEGKRGMALSHFGVKSYSALEIDLPTLIEQHEIVRLQNSFFEKELEAKKLCDDVLEKIDLIKKAILARAFRGELGTNDLNEESAVELLKEILK